MKRMLPCVMLFLSVLLLFSACQTSQGSEDTDEAVPVVPEVTAPLEPETDDSPASEESTAVSSPYEFISLTAVTLDGADLAVPDDFYCLEPEYYSSYYRFDTLLELLNVEGISTFEEPELFHDVTVPPYSVATYCQGYVTTLTLDDTFTFSTAPGETEPEYAEFAAQLAEVNGSYYLQSVDIPDLFLTGAEEIWEEDYTQVEALHLTSLDTAIEEAKSFAESQGYVYEPTGDPFYDCYILSDRVIARTKADDAASVFWMSEGRMLMGPIMDDVTAMTYGYKRTMRDADGNLLYGYYASPYGNETLEVCYSELECVDVRNGLYSIAVGFGDAKRYGAALIPNGMVNELHMLEPYSETPLTVDEMLDYFLGQGYFTEGQWEQTVYLPALETEDLEAFSDNSQGEIASLQLLLPVSWNSNGSSTDYWEGEGFNNWYHKTELRMSLGSVITVPQSLLDAHPEDFWQSLYPDEAAQSTEVTQLEDRSVLCVTLPSEMSESGKTFIPYHYYIYFQENGALFDMTLYGEEDSPYARAQFQRMAETVELTDFWKQ